MPGLSAEQIAAFEADGFLLPIRVMPESEAAALLATVSVMMGLAAGPLFELALSAGEELSDPTHYVEAVLGGAR